VYVTWRQESCSSIESPKVWGHVASQKAYGDIGGGDIGGGACGVLIGSIGGPDGGEGGKGGCTGGGGGGEGRAVVEPQKADGSLN
jgi:hypothetical protein